MRHQLRILYVNTHVGESIFKGGLAKAKAKHDPDLAVILEVGRLPAKLALRRVFRRRNWHAVGIRPLPLPGMVESGTTILGKRSVLKKVWGSNRLLTRQRFLEDGTRDRWHPLRRLTRGFYRFRGSQVQLHVGADHAWTHAGHPLHGRHEVPTTARHQIQAFAEESAKSVAQGIATIDVGDMNVGLNEGPFVHNTFERQAAMEVLVRQNLDFLLASDRVSLVSVERISMDELDTDHDGFLAVLEVW